MNNSKSQPATIFSAFIAVLISSALCSAEEYYNRNDFMRVEKIDAHVHANTQDPTFVELAEKNKFRLISINTDYAGFPQLPVQLRIAKNFSKTHRETLAYAATFSFKDWEEPGWFENTIETIDNARKNRAVAIKVWKNIGMDIRGKDGKLVMVNDRRLAPVFAYLSSSGIPLIGHQGEPKNCWLPLEGMTVKNDQMYFAAHPQFHMYKHPELPSYEDHMKARDDLLDKNHDLRFVGAHMASLEWSTDELAIFLDRFPNSVIDVAARMGHIQHQSAINHAKVRDFFIKYQDRILYGSDITHQPNVSASFFRKQVAYTWNNDWRYLVEADVLDVYVLGNRVKGLHLPKAVIDKIYRKNALNVYFSASSWNN